MTHGDSAAAAKRAATDHSILDVLAERWSPRAWADRPIETDKLQRLFEAARWAPSSYNEQPWRFFVARRHSDAWWPDALASLNEWNRGWAASAPVLVVTAVSRVFQRNGRPNRTAEHDLGLAMGNLLAQATAEGLHVHQMAGILPDEARRRFAVPDGFDVVTAAAIGYLGAPDQLAEDFRAEETAPRTRRPLSGSVFGGSWEEPSPFVGG
ncbi:MAG: nitroreductase family protein [Gemmatimonadota bacterium]|nr:nitroreductase family protein [Gemmatimonadota bacterium]